MNIIIKKDHYENYHKSYVYYAVLQNKPELRIIVWQFGVEGQVIFIEILSNANISQ